MCIFFTECNVIENVALTSKAERMLGGIFTEESVKGAEELRFIYEDSNGKGEMPIPIFDTEDKSSFASWFQQIIDDYQIIDDDGNYNFIKIRDYLRVKVTYDSDGNMVEQMLVDNN